MLQLQVQYPPGCELVSFCSYEAFRVVVYGLGGLIFTQPAVQRKTTLTLSCLGRRIETTKTRTGQRRPRRRRSGGAWRKSATTPRTWRWATTWRSPWRRGSTSSTTLSKWAASDWLKAFSIWGADPVWLTRLQTGAVDWAEHQFSNLQQRKENGTIDGADKEILAEAERLDVKAMGPLILSELLFNENIREQIKKYKRHFLRVSLRQRVCRTPACLSGSFIFHFYGRNDVRFFILIYFYLVLPQQQESPEVSAGRIWVRREAAPGSAAASRSHHPQRPVRCRPAGGRCHFCLGGEGEFQDPSQQLKRWSRRLRLPRAVDRFSITRILSVCLKHRRVFDVLNSEIHLFSIRFLKSTSPRNLPKRSTPRLPLLLNGWRRLRRRVRAVRKRRRRRMRM